MGFNLGLGFYVFSISNVFFHLYCTTPVVPKQCGLNWNLSWNNPEGFGVFEVASWPSSKQFWLGPDSGLNPLETMGGIFKGIRGWWTIISLRRFKNESVYFSFFLNFPWLYSLEEEGTSKFEINGHKGEGNARHPNLTQVVPPPFTPSQIREDRSEQQGNLRASTLMKRLRKGWQ